jgi:hypothetical protein
MDLAHKHSNCEPAPSRSGTDTDHYAINAALVRASIRRESMIESKKCKWIRESKLARKNTTGSIRLTLKFESPVFLFSDQVSSFSFAYIHHLEASMRIYGFLR